MKDEIRKNFSKAASRYDDYATVQRICRGRLLRKASLLEGVEPILDIGAGTGSPFPSAFTVDIAYGMAKTCYLKGHRSVCANGEELPFRPESFQMVVSNFSLQWTDFRKVFFEVGRVLKRGGFFFLSLPVEGSLRTIYFNWEKATGKPIPFRFPDPVDVYTALSRDFEVIEYELMEFNMKFSNPLDALKSVNKIGARVPLKAKVGDLRKFLSLYSRNPVVGYKVLFLTAVKP